jgi:hypothetical protein
MTHEFSDRDDIYSLSRGGCKVNTSNLPRVARLDREHIFTDDHGGEMLSASLIKGRNNKRIGAVKGKTMKLGVSHSHEGNRHKYHIIEDVGTRRTDLICRFKRWVQTFRNERKKSRDR